MLSTDWLIRNHRTLLIIAGVSLTLIAATMLLGSIGTGLFALLALLMAVMAFGAVGGLVGVFLSQLREEAFRHLEPAMAAEPTLQRIDQAGAISAPALASRFDTCAEGADHGIPAGVTGPVNLEVLGDVHTVHSTGFLWRYRTGHSENAPVMVRALGMVALPRQAPSARRMVIRWAGGVSDPRRAAQKVSTADRVTITGTDESLKAAILDASAQSLLGVSVEPRVLEIRGRFLLLVYPYAATGLREGMRPQMLDRMLALRGEAAQLAEVILTLDQLPASVKGLDGDDQSGAGG